MTEHSDAAQDGIAPRDDSSAVESSPVEDGGKIHPLFGDIDVKRDVQGLDVSARGPGGWQAAARFLRRSEDDFALIVLVSDLTFVSGGVIAWCSRDLAAGAMVVIAALVVAWPRWRHGGSGGRRPGT